MSKKTADVTHEANYSDVIENHASVTSRTSLLYSNRTEELLKVICGHLSSRCISK